MTANTSIPAVPVPAAIADHITDVLSDPTGSLIALLIDWVESRFDDTIFDSLDDEDINALVDVARAHGYLVLARKLGARWCNDVAALDALSGQSLDTRCGDTQDGASSCAQSQDLHWAILRWACDEEYRLSGWTSAEVETFAAYIAHTGHPEYGATLVTHWAEVHPDEFIDWDDPAFAELFHWWASLT